MKSYPLLINGKEEEGSGWSYIPHAREWIADAAGALTLRRQLELGNIDVDSVEPGRIAGCCARGEVGDFERALEAAKKAQRVFSSFPLKDRARIADEVYQDLSTRAAEFIEVLIAEGHPRKLAEWELSGMLSYVSPETTAWLVSQMEQEFESGSRRLRIIRKADGVVCISPPQNAAASNSFFGIGALMAGNALVVKAPQSCPLGVMYLFHEVVNPVLERNEVPPGTLNIISGNSRRIMKQWVDSPCVDDILFFGDSKTGLKIGEECIAHGKKAILELSGNDGFVVWRDASLDRAAEALTESFYGSSQICMVPKYAIVHPDVADDFFARFLPLVHALAPGYPDDEGTVLTPVFKPARFFEMLAQAVNAGGQMLTGGERVDVEGKSQFDGVFIQPTVVRIDGLALGDRLECVREETFFPLLSVIVPDPSETLDDAMMLEQVIDFLRANQYCLRNSLWSQGTETINSFVQGVDNSGILKVNDSHIEFVPYIATHGGRGLTGGPYGELHYPALRTSHMQGVVVAN